MLLYELGEYKSYSIRAAVQRAELCEVLDPRVHSPRKSSGQEEPLYGKS